jgi:hypothetical protein
MEYPFGLRSTAVAGVPFGNLGVLLAHPTGYMPARRI